MIFWNTLYLKKFLVCLIESLASPEKQTLKTETGMISPWLLALSSFVGALYRRYNIDLDGMLYYVINQLKDGKR
jgi:THO complex subunit 2